MPEDLELLLMQIGRRIVARREALGLTQRTLAEKVGMQPANVNRIEHGKQNLTVDTLLRLADALETTAAELFTGRHPR